MVRDRTTFAARQSPLGIPMLMIGISRSLTTEVTTRPSAAPVMTPTASASAFCLRRNSRNSRYMPRIIGERVNGGARAARGKGGITPPPEGRGLLLVGCDRREHVQRLG